MAKAVGAGIQVEVWKAGGVVTGFLLLLFGGAIVATSTYNNDVFAPNFLGRKLQAPISSTLLQPSIINSNQIYLVSVAGFAVGQSIQIEPGSLVAEQNIISQVNPTEKALVLQTATLQAHPSGATVTTATAATQSSSLNSFDSSSGSSSSQSLASSESGSSAGDLKATWSWAAGISTSTWANVQLILSIIYACIYKSKVVDVMGVMPARPLQGAHALEPGLLDCLFDCGMCHIVLYCPCIRAAQNNHAADVCGYWETFVLMWLSTFCVACGAPLCLNVYFRMHLKDHLGLDDDCFNDFIISFCCYHFSLGQQGLAVDQALGYTFKFPCTVTPVDPMSKMKTAYQAQNHNYQNWGQVS